MTGKKLNIQYIILSLQGKENHLPSSSFKCSTCQLKTIVSMANGHVSCCHNLTCCKLICLCCRYFKVSSLRPLHHFVPWLICHQFLVSKGTYRPICIFKWNLVCHLLIVQIGLFVVILDLLYSIFHLNYFSARHNVSLKGLFV